jgi:hypothetical protein
MPNANGLKPVMSAGVVSIVYAKILMFTFLFNFQDFPNKDIKN